MIDLKIIHSGIYRKRERHTQTTTSFWVGLYVSGLLRQRVLLPDGTELESFTSDPGPHLFWRASGMQIDFAYGTKRENRVLMLHSGALHYEANSHTLYANWQGQPLSLPFSRKVRPEHLPSLRRQFDEINRLWHEGLPASRLCANLLAGGILASCLPLPDAAPCPADPAERLRQLIDADTRFEHDLAGLCKKTGYSADYLRLCFEKKYHLLPRQYRENLRIRKIMELIADSDLSTKQIAAQTGLRHVSHLNILLRRAFDRTPTELIRTHRFRSPG